MVVLGGGGAVSYERGTPVCECATPGNWNGHVSCGEKDQTRKNAPHLALPHSLTDHPQDDMLDLRYTSVNFGVETSLVSHQIDGSKLAEAELGVPNLGQANPQLEIILTSPRQVRTWHK